MLLTRCLIGHFCIDWYYRKVGRIWTPNWTRPSLSFLSMSTPRQKARPESTESPESLPESPASLESPDSLESPELPKSNGSPILSLGSIGLHPFHPPGDQLAISIHRQHCTGVHGGRRPGLNITQMMAWQSDHLQRTKRIWVTYKALWNFAGISNT